jgi:PHD/YefM family antitoxin component YafN of YafNO toxin-antitoxin module
MQVVSATDFKKNMAYWLDQVRIGPVTIRRHARDAAVLISPELFQDYLRLKREARKHAKRTPR